MNCKKALICVYMWAYFKEKPMKNFIATLAILMMLTGFAHAQDSDGLRLPPPGTTILNLSATETQKVPQDLLVASLRIEVDNDDLSAVQSKINMAMQVALDLAKNEKEIKATTGAYSVWPYDIRPYEEQQKGGEAKNRWRGQQTIELQSLNSESLLKVVGQIQEKGFAMNNLSYTLSPEKYESVQDALLEKALQKLTTKAELAAKALKKSSVEMVDVNLSSSGPVYPMMYARAEMAMDAGMAKSAPAPIAQAGESDVSLTVSARAILKP